MEQKNKNKIKGIFKFNNLKYLIFICILVVFSYILSFEKYILAIFSIYPIYLIAFPKRKDEKRIIDILSGFFIFLITLLIKRVLGKNIDVYLSQIVMTIIISFYLSLISVFWDKERNNLEKKGFLSVVYYFLFGLSYILFLKNGVFSSLKNTKTAFISLDEYMIGVMPLFKTILIFFIFFQIKAMLNTETKKENRSKNKINILKPISITFAILALIIVGNTPYERYIDTSEEQIFELNNEERKKISEVNTKTYIFMDSKEVLWYEEVALAKVASKNKNIKYVKTKLDKKSLEYILLDKDIKEEIEKFNKYKEEEYKTRKNKETAEIFVITKTNDGRRVETTNSLKDGGVLKFTSKYPSQEMTKRVIDLILSGNVREKRKTEKIGIIQGKIDLRDIKGLIQDLESYGYFIEKVDLKNEISDDFKMLILLSPKQDLTDEENKNLNMFLDNGGKLFLTYQNRNKQEEFKNLNNLVSSYGAKYKDEQILENNPLNKAIFSNKEEVNKKLYELDKIYKKGGSTKDIQKLQNEIKNIAYVANNDIVFARTFKNTFKKDLESAMLMPGVLEIDENKIYEEKINLTTLIETSEHAFSLEKYNGELTTVMDLRETALKADKQGIFKVGVKLQKPNKGEIILFTSSGFLIDEIKALEEKYDFYLMKDNREIILNTIFDSMENEDRVLDEKVYSVSPDVDEKQYDKSVRIVFLVNIILLITIYYVFIRKTC